MSHVFALTPKALECTARQTTTPPRFCRGLAVVQVRVCTETYGAAAVRDSPPGSDRGTAAGAVYQLSCRTTFGISGSPSYAGVMICTPNSLNTSRMLRCSWEYSWFMAGTLSQ